MADFSPEGIEELAAAARHDLARAQDRARLLVRALRYADSEQARADAAEALIRLGAPAVVPLIEYVTDDQVSRGGAAQHVLVQIGSAAAEPLIELLGHPDARVRAAVAWMFTGIVDPRACGALVRALDDADDAVRQCAAYALGDQHCYLAVPKLIEMLEDVTVRVGGQSVDPELEELLFQQLRLDIDVAGQLWDDSVSQLFPEESSETVALHEDQDDEGEDYVGAAVAYALGTIGDPRAVEPLARVARDEGRDGVVRGQAVWALGAIADPRSYDIVLSSLEDPDCEPEALSALGGFRDPRSLPVFARYYRHPCGYLRQQTVVGLRQHGGPVVLPYLLALLHDRDELVRAAAASALGALGDPRAIDALMYSLRYGDERFRRVVLDALDDIAAAEG